MVVPLTAMSLRWNHYLGSPILEPDADVVAMASRRSLVRADSLVRSFSECTANSRVGDDRSVDAAALPPVVIVSSTCAGKERFLEVVEEDNYVSQGSIHDLPLEILLRIFRHVDDVRWLLACSRVSRSWRSLALDPSLWQVLHLKSWFSGDWSLSPDGWQGRAMPVVDDDEDDDGESTVSSDDALSTDDHRSVEEERRFLEAICDNLLPVVGRGARSLSVRNSSAVDNHLVRSHMARCFFFFFFFALVLDAVL